MATILLVQNSTESNFRHKCHLRLNQEECQLRIHLKGRVNNPEDKQVTAESSSALPPVQTVSGAARLSPLHRPGRQVRKRPAEAWRQRPHRAGLPFGMGRSCLAEVMEAQVGTAEGRAEAGFHCVCKTSRGDF